jgi:hypothetical protein
MASASRSARRSSEFNGDKLMEPVERDFHNSQLSVINKQANQEENLQLATF